MNLISLKNDYNKRLTEQISAVTFCAKTRTKGDSGNLLGEPGVMHSNIGRFYGI